MSESNEDDQPEIGEYNSLASEEPPPADLEEKVLLALRAQGLVNNRKTKAAMSRHWKTAATIAACLMFFAAGTLYEKRQSPPIDRFVTMTEKTFLLLLVEDQRYQQAKNVQEELQRIDLYRNWAISLRKKGLMLNGTKLQPQRYFLTSGTSIQADRSEIAGYFLIDAGDLEQAMEIARTCPHLRFGGQIEVRQIQPV